MKSFQLIIILLSLFLFPVFGQNKNPKIGLTLSGGGAKGLAHIGALKVIDSLGIRIDYISGTSMGSIVGGLYAIGYSIKRIEELAKSLDWKDLFMDYTPRRSLSIEEKDEDGKFVSVFPIQKRKILLPTGWSGGQKISNKLASLTWSVHYIDDFKKFKIPFCCIATDIENVKAVVLNKGFLPDALHSSAAMPSIFKPVEINDQLLLDGGIVRNFPISDVMEMGAEYVIGVDVTAPLYKKNQLKTLWEILDQASTYTIAETNTEQRKNCNLFIRPEIEEFGNFDFEMIDSLIKLGEIAALKMKDQLIFLRDSLNGKKTETIQSEYEDFQSIYINSYRIEGRSRVSKNLVLGNLNLKIPGWVTLKQIEKGIERIYGTLYFERVNYKLENIEEGTELVIRLKEQTNNYLKLGLNYDSNLKSGVLLNFTFRNILGEGSRLLLDAKLGEHPAFKTQYSIHTRLKPNIGFTTQLIYNNFEENYYDNLDKIISKFEVDHYSASAGLHTSLSNSVQISSGISANAFDQNPLITAFDTINLSTHSFSLYVHSIIENLNKAVFSDKGMRLMTEIRYYFKNKYYVGSFAPTFLRMNFNYSRFIPLSKKFCFNLNAAGGLIIESNVHNANHFYLGAENPYEINHIQIPGMKYMGISTPNFISAGAALRREIGTEKYLFLKYTFTNLGTYYADLKEFSSVIHSFALSFGMKTLIGPIEIQVGKSTLSNDLETTLRLGYFF